MKLNWQLLLAALVTVALGVSALKEPTWQSILAVVAGVVGTYFVRPSQVSPTLGATVAKMPGTGGTTDAQKKTQAQDETAA